MQRLVRWLRFNLMYLRGKPPWDTGISPPELIEFIAQHPPGRAIDLGCGTGTNLLALGKAGWQVTGVDFAFQAVAAARRRLKAAGIPADVRAGDVARLENVRSRDGKGYDLALDIGCYHGLDDDRRALYRQNLAEVLSPGGAYLLYAFWRAEGAPRPMGLTQGDFDALCSLFYLENRQDGQDARGRDSSWMRFRNVSSSPVP